MRLWLLASACLIARPLAAQVGSRVISYAPVGGPPVSAVVPTPYLDLGGGGTEAESFNWIVAVRRQTSGTILVATYDPIQIRAFDPQGRRLGQFGRKGQGPGEYLDIKNLVVLPGDSLLVLDPMQRRITRLGPDGTVTGTVQFTPPFASSPFDVSLQAFADATLLIGYSEVTATKPSPRPVTVLQHVGRYDQTGVRRDSLGLFFAGEYFLQATPVHVGGGSAFWDRAFGRRGVLVADGRAVWLSDATTVDISKLDLHGKLLERHRLEVASSPVTTAMVAKYRSDALAKASANDRAVEERRVAEMPFPAQLPAFRQLLVDARARLWLQQYIYPQPAPNRWWILDPADRRARSVLLPDRFVPYVIGRADIVGVWQDSDDVEHVRAYRLTF